MTDIHTDRISLVIRLAWEDRTSFEEIKERTGLAEREVIDIMRRELKASSFVLWRKRVGGRVTKHRKLPEQAVVHELIESCFRTEGIRSFNLKNP
jgi:uncharacterized protein (TIGR03643 family)